MKSVRKESYGCCRFERTSPKWGKVTPNTRILNIVIPFEEALKLKLSIEACLLELNTYKRSTIEGKRAAINLAIGLAENTISIDEEKLQKSK